MIFNRNLTFTSHYLSSSSSGKAGPTSTTPGRAWTPSLSRKSKGSRSWKTSRRKTM